MRKLLAGVLLIILGVLPSLGVHAQDGWDVVENCMGDLNYPIIAQENWDFPGIIITSFYPQGVRAIRADQNVEYFLALESGDSFPAVGTLSADGRYFAYPVGHTTYNVNSGGDDIIAVDFIRIVRSDGNTEETYRFEANNYTYSGSFGSLNLPRTVWLGNDYVYYQRVGSTPDIFVFANQQLIEWENTVHPFYLNFISPDATRAFTDDSLYDLDNDEPLTYPESTQVAWFADSSAFIASGEQLILVDRDGETSDVIWIGETFGAEVAPNGEYASFWDVENNLYLVDIGEGVVYDLCFEGTYSPIASINWEPNLAWSPDSSSLAFVYDGYLILLDVQTFQNQVLDHRAEYVMGWASLDTEVVEQTEIEIRSPELSTPVPTPTEIGAVPPTEIPPTANPSAETCQLDVIVGANLRDQPTLESERIGSVAEGFELVAVMQQFNDAEFFTYWQLDTGEWLREDFVREDENCQFLPTPEESEAQAD